MNWIARVFMGLFGLVFLAGVLAALGVYMVFASVRWLLTGRKPQGVLVWQLFRNMRKQGPVGRAAWGNDAAANADVVDVDVREVQEVPEVKEDAPRLPPRQQG